MVCEGVMRVAYMNMRNTSVNCPTPLTLYKLIWERVCGSTNTTVLSGDSVTSPPTCVWRAAGFIFNVLVCAYMHALDLSQYT